MRVSERRSPEGAAAGVSQASGGNPPENPRCGGFGPPPAAYNPQGVESPMSPKDPLCLVQSGDKKIVTIKPGRRPLTARDLTPRPGGVNISEEGVSRLFRPLRRIR